MTTMFPNLRHIRFFVAAALIFIGAALFVSSASAYWVWTPGTKKFINPKYAVKDSPKEQFDWAMSFFDAKDYARAATEFEKLTKHYEYSEYASKAQYYAGMAYENQGKHYLAFTAYQKGIDNYPHIDNIEEIIARQFEIGTIFAEKNNPKVLGTDIMTSTDKAVEVFRKVVDNAPFGKLADKAQYRMGEVLRDASRYDEAANAFQKLTEDYPTSEFAEKAQYELAFCAYMASLKPDYDAGPTDKAIKAFQSFAEANKDSALSKEADKTIQRLKDKGAEKIMKTAQFYEQTKHKESAIIYYQEVLNTYPDSTLAPEARAKIDELRTGKKRPEAQGKMWKGFFGKKAEKASPAPAAAPEIVAEEKAVETKQEETVTAPAQPVAQPPSSQTEAEPAAPQEQPAAIPVKLMEETPAATAPVTVPTQKEDPVVSQAVPQAPVTTVAETAATAAAQPKQIVVQFQGSQEPQPASAVVETSQQAPQVATVQAPPVAEKPRAVKRSKPQPVEPAKKGWFPVLFGKKEESKKPVAAKPEKKGWTPFSFDKKEVKEKEVPQKTEKKAWTPLSFDKKEEVKKAAPAVAEKKAWAPLSFEKKEEAAKSAPAVAEKKAWTPLSFGKKPDNADKDAVKVASPAEDVKEKTKKGWVPFSFGKKAEETEKAAVSQEKAGQDARDPAKKGWTPLKFN